MPSKIWKASYKDLEIEFHNQWRFSGGCDEEVYINGQLQDERSTNMLKGLRDSASSHYEQDFHHNGTDNHLEIRAGSKWHGMSVGCHIYVNGELVGGDLKSRLWLAGPDGFRLVAPN